MLKSRIVTYPILASTAAVCIAPVVERGLDGLAESCVRVGVAIFAILAE